MALLPPETLGLTPMTCRLPVILHAHVVSVILQLRQKQVQAARPYDGICGSTSPYIPLSHGARGTHALACITLPRESACCAVTLLQQPLNLLLRKGGLISVTLSVTFTHCAFTRPLSWGTHMTALCVDVGVCVWQEPFSKMGPQDVIVYREVIHTLKDMYVCHLYVCMSYACMYVCMHVCMCVHIRTHTHTLSLSLSLSLSLTHTHCVCVCLSLSRPCTCVCVCRWSRGRAMCSRPLIISRQPRCASSNKPCVRSLAYTYTLCVRAHVLHA